MPELKNTNSTEFESDFETRVVANLTVEAF